MDVAEAIAYSTIVEMGWSRTSAIVEVSLNAGISKRTMETAIQKIRRDYGANLHV